jgi:hypothetical protein
MKPPLVLIEWEDSAQPQPAWRWLEGYEPSGIVRVRSVGWLILDGDVKALAPNLGRDGEADEQVSGVIQIPARCVLTVSELVARDTDRNPKGENGEAG